MKKYQLWLERKSYSQHLFNLMKIKQSCQSPQKVQRALTQKLPNNQNMGLHKYHKIQQYHSQAEKLGDISYAITYKEMKNRKLRLMKSFDIKNENMSMARRIREVKSVFNSTKDKFHVTEYGKRKLFEKKIEYSNVQLRQLNFKRFAKFQNNKINHKIHKYILSIKAEPISKFIHLHDQFAAAWCEISTEKGFLKSDLKNINENKGYKFQFALENQPQEYILYKFYSCKGLKSEFLGQVQFKRPPINQILQDEYQTDDTGLKFKLKISYHKIQRLKVAFSIK